MSVYAKLGINEDEGDDPQLIEQIKLKLNQVKITAAQAGKNHDAEETLTIVAVILMAVRFISQLKPWEATAFGQQLEAYAMGQQALATAPPAAPQHPQAVAAAPQSGAQAPDLKADLLKFFDDLQQEVLGASETVEKKQDLDRISKNIIDAYKSAASTAAAKPSDTSATKAELEKIVRNYNEADDKAEKARGRKPGYSDKGIGVHMQAVRNLVGSIEAVAKRL